MAHLKSHDQLESELEEAKKLVKIGGIYTHFKNPEHHYKIIDVAIQEATDKVCIIYQTLYGKKLLFIRDLDSWISQPEVDGKKVDRFTLVPTRRLY